MFKFDWCIEQKILDEDALYWSKSMNNRTFTSSLSTTDIYISNKQWPPLSMSLDDRRRVAIGYVISRR